MLQHIGTIGDVAAASEALPRDRGAAWGRADSLLSFKKGLQLLITRFPGIHCTSPDVFLST